MARNVIIDFFARAVGFEEIPKAGAKAAKQTEKEFEKSTKKISDQFSNLSTQVAAVFGAFAAGAVAGKAIKASNDLEKALIGLGAAAKQAGLNAQALEKDVVALSKDGTISVNQLTASYKILLNQGLSPEFIKRLLESGKAVSALNNITGDAGQALSDFVKGVATGSADLVENFNPSIRQTINQLGGFEKISKSAEAKQKLYNAVIEQGGKLQDDYNKILTSGAGAFDSASKATDNFFVAIGDGLKVALVPLLNVLTPVIEGFTKLFNSLSPAGKAVAVLIPLITALTPALIGLFTALKGISLTVGTLTVGLGPLVLGLTAITVATVAIVDATSKFIKQQELERRALLATKDATKLTKDEKEELARLNKKYAEEAAFLKALNAENKALSIQTALLRSRAFIQNNQAEIEKFGGLEGFAKAKEAQFADQFERDVTNIGRRLGRPVGGDEGFAATVNALSPNARTPQEKIDAVRLALQQYAADGAITQQQADAQFQQLFARGNRGTQSAGGIAADIQAARFALNPASATGVAAPSVTPSSGGGGKAEKGSELQFLQFIEARREAFNEQLRLELIEERKNAELISKEKQETEAQLQQRLTKITEAEARKRAQFELNLAAEASQKAGTIAQGAAQAFTADNLGGQLQGAATAAGAINPAVGGIIGGIAGVVGAFEVLSGKAQREAKERELNNRQLEAERQLREQINKNLLQEQQALDEATQIQLRVNNLTLGKDGAQSANRSVLEATAARQAAEAGLSGTSATEVGGELQDIITRGPDNAILASTIQSAAEVARGNRRTDLSKAISLLDRALATAENASPELIKTATDYRASLREILTARNQLAADQRAGKAEFGEFDRLDALRSAASQAATGAARSFTRGESGTLDRSQALLATLEALQQLDGSSGAGSGNISLQSARAQSFIDIGRGGVADSFGIFRAPTVRPNLLGLPTGGVSQAIASLDKQESFQERSTKSLEQLVDIAKSQLAELKAISAAAGVNNTNEQRIFSTLESIERRII